VEGIPRDLQHVAPRIGLAWDPAGDGRQSYTRRLGLFYDIRCWLLHFRRRDCRRWPLRAVLLYRQHSLRLRPACPRRPPPSSDRVSIHRQTSTAHPFSRGALNALPNMSYLPNQQRSILLLPVHSLPTKIT